MSDPLQVADPGSGLLVIDKPQGPTSHGAVARIRRTLGTRNVGHAGTLDPMASGVLVVLVGSGTKLSQFLALDDKVYRAVVRLGQGTDTLDADGVLVEDAPLSGALVEHLVRIEAGDLCIPHGSLLGNALDVEERRTEQTPPLHSAIKHGGVASYVRARRGEQVVLPSRGVRVLRLQVVGATVDPPALCIEAHVSKGYYVRSLARDLGMALGVPAHLSELRRIRSGCFAITDAVGLHEGADVLREAMLGVEQVARSVFACCTLTAHGVVRALCGQPMSDQDFEQVPGEDACAWFAPEGRLVAVGDRSKGRPTVLRAWCVKDDCVRAKPDWGEE